MDAELALAGIDVSHFFGGGSYVKLTFIPAGIELTQHSHSHDHLSMLVSGSVVLTAVRGESVVEHLLSGPYVTTLEAHVPHRVRAISPAVWACIWATSCTDPETVDQAILGG